MNNDNDNNDESLLLLQAPALQHPQLVCEYFLCHPDLILRIDEWICVLLEREPVEYADDYVAFFLNHEAANIACITSTRQNIVTWCIANQAYTHALLFVDFLLQDNYFDIEWLCVQLSMPHVTIELRLMLSRTVVECWCKVCQAVGIDERAIVALNVMLLYVINLCAEIETCSKRRYVIDCTSSAVNSMLLRLASPSVCQIRVGCAFVEFINAFFKQVPTNYIYASLSARVRNKLVCRANDCICKLYPSSHKIDLLHT